jgi:accessory gene regulator protein AgrB
MPTGAITSLKGSGKRMKKGFKHNTSWKNRKEARNMYFMLAILIISAIIAVILKFVLNVNIHYRVISIIIFLPIAYYLFVKQKKSLWN